MEKMRKFANIILIILAIVICTCAFMGCKSGLQKSKSEKAVEVRGTTPLSDYEIGTSENYQYILMYFNWDPDPEEANRNNVVYYLSIEAGVDIDLDVPNPSYADINGDRYVFEGWYLDAQYYTEIETFTSSSFTSSTYDSTQQKYFPTLTVYAKWTVYRTLTIAFELTHNSKTGTNDARNVNQQNGTRTFLSSDVVTLYDATPPADDSSSYYTFDGWYTSSGTQITEVSVDLYSNNASSITIYAHYVSTSFDKIKFVLNGNNQQTIQYNTTTNTVTVGDITLTSTGEGAYDLTSVGSAYRLYQDTDNNVYMRRTQAMGTIELTKIDIAKAMLYCESSPGVPDLSKPLTSYAKVVTMPVRTPFVEGWWYMNNIVEASKPTATLLEGDVTVYARWSETAEGYLLDYVLNGGQATLNPTYVVAGNSITLADATRINFGYVRYTFLGWYRTYNEGSESSSESWSNRVYDPADAQANKTYTPTANTTFYARWDDEDVYYSITYNLVGGKWEQGAAVSYTHNYDYSLPHPVWDPENGEEGYSYAFAGWYETYENGVYSDEVSVAKTSDLVVYAKWTRHKIWQVTYFLDGGEWATNKQNPSTYSLADGTVNLYDPIRRSSDSRIVFNFKGWYINGGVYISENLITQLDFHVESALDVLAVKYKTAADGTTNVDTIKLYAVWEQKPDTFIITYELGKTIQNGDIVDVVLPSGEEVINNKKNPAYVSTLNNARDLYAPKRIKYVYNMTGSTINYITITTYEFLGWKEEDGTTVTILNYQDKERVLYPIWGSSTTYNFKPDTAIRVDEYMRPSSSGEYVLYGVYPQTKVDVSTSYTVTVSSKYYRKEPVMWKYVGYIAEEYVYMSTNVLDCVDYDDGVNRTEDDKTIYDGDENFITITGVSSTILRPAKTDFDDMAEEDRIKSASDYAENAGLTVDDKMGTASYWLEGTKDLSTSGAAIDDQTASQLSGSGMLFRYYVGSRGNISYTESTRTTIGSVAVVCLASQVTNYSSYNP